MSEVPITAPARKGRTTTQARSLSLTRPGDGAKLLQTLPTAHTTPALKPGLLLAPMLRSWLIAVRTLPANTAALAGAATQARSMGWWANLAAA